MILSYGNNNDSFSCDSDSSSASNSSNISQSLSDLQPIPKQTKKTFNNKKNIFTKENKDTTNGKKKQTEISDDDLLRTLAGMKLKGVKSKLKAEANDLSLIGEEKFYSNDTLNLLNTSGRKSFLDSETELSINFSFLNNKQKKPKSRCYSSGSLPNLAKDFQDQDSINLLKNMIKSDKDVISHLYLNDKQISKKNPKSVNELNIYDDSLNSIDCENLKNNLLKSEDKINSLDHSLTSEFNSGGKKKANFIPKSELIKENSQGSPSANYNQFNQNSNLNNKMNLSEPTGHINLNQHNKLINNSMMNYYDTSPRKYMKPIEEMPDKETVRSNNDSSTELEMYKRTQSRNSTNPQVINSSSSVNSHSLNQKFNYEIKNNCNNSNNSGNYCKDDLNVNNGKYVNSGNLPNMNVNMIQNMQNIQNIQNTQNYNQNSYNNNLNNSNIHNNSNSTEDLFASINNKIDNLNLTTYTQNSFIGGSKNEVNNMNPYVQFNPYVNMNTYMNNFNNETSVIENNMDSIGSIGNFANKKNMNNNSNMKHMNNYNLDTMSSFNMNNFSTINNLNMNNINAMSKLKNFNNFNNFQDRDRENFNNLNFPRETDYNMNILSNMSNIDNVKNNYQSGIPYLNEDYEDEDEDDDDQDRPHLNININQNKLLQSTGMGINSNTNFSNVPTHHRKKNSSNKFHNPGQFNQINMPQSNFNINRTVHNLQIPHLNKNTQMNHINQKAQNSLPNFMNNNFSSSNQVTSTNKKESKTKPLPNQVPYQNQQTQNSKQNQPQKNKNNQTGYSDLSDEEVARIAGIIAKDQSGCRFVQKRIMDNPGFANEILFFEIQTYMLDLINDAFGNYLVQKLIEYIDEEKIEWIINLIEPYFVEICSSPHGTRVIQKIIECLNTENLMLKFNTIFANSLLIISKDPNANHIVHKYVYTIKSPHNQFIYDMILDNLVDVATDKHGCCVMQKLIDAGDINQKNVLIDVVLKRTLNFMADQYANYIIQFILSLNDYNINKSIAEIFFPDMSYLSKQKFSSNVIEKCFDHSNEELQELLVNEIIKDEDLISELIVDMYGNYVLQKALAVAKGENYMKMLRIISNNLDKLKLVPFGNKLLAKFLYTYKELPSMISSKGNLSNVHNIKNNNSSNNANSYQLGKGSLKPHSNSSSLMNNMNSMNHINNMNSVNNMNNINSQIQMGNLNQMGHMTQMNNFNSSNPNNLKNMKLMNNPKMNLLANMNQVNSHANTKMQHRHSNPNKIISESPLVQNNNINQMKGINNMNNFNFDNQGNFYSPNPNLNLYPAQGQYMNPINPMSGMSQLNSGFPGFNYNPQNQMMYTQSQSQPLNPKKNKNSMNKNMY